MDPIPDTKKEVKRHYRRMSEHDASSQQDASEFTNG